MRGVVEDLAAYALLLIVVLLFGVWLVLEGLVVFARPRIVVLLLLALRVIGVPGIVGFLVVCATIVVGNNGDGCSA